jgi:hypothetical protein
MYRLILSVFVVSCSLYLICQTNCFERPIADSSLIDLHQFSAVNTTLAPVPKGTDKESFFFPTAIGTKWVYEISGGETLTLFIANRIDTNGNEKGVEITINEVGENGESSYYETVKITQKGLFLVDHKRQDLAIPLCELRLPHEDGFSWSETISVRSKGEKVDFIKTHKFKAFGPEEVSVPAGKYQAIRVEDNDLTNRYIAVWYAPNIGMVKSVREYGPIDQKPSVSTIILKSFSLGK